MNFISIECRKTIRICRKVEATDPTEVVRKMLLMGYAALKLKIIKIRIWDLE